MCPPNHFSPSDSVPTPAVRCFGADGGFGTFSVCSSQLRLGHGVPASSFQRPCVLRHASECLDPNGHYTKGGEPGNMKFLKRCARRAAPLLPR